MPQGMEFELRLAAFVDQASFALQRIPQATGNIRHPLDIAAAVREDETDFTLRADELPFTQGIREERGHWDRPMAGMRLRLAQRSPFIGTLPHRNRPSFEIDGGPCQPANLARAHASKDRCRKKRPPA